MTPGSSEDANVRLRRAYEEPRADDGHRVLVDRVWPRGRTKAQLRLDAWARDLAPSAGPRMWFGHDPERWMAFRSRYRAELTDPARSQALDTLAEIAQGRQVTIVYGARDREHNQAQVIADEIEGRLTDPSIPKSADRPAPVPSTPDVMLRARRA